MENRIAIVETGADEGMSNRRCSVTVETVSDVSGVPWLVCLFIESDRLV